MIRRRNLDPSLKNWIMNETGLGPGIGQVRFLVGEDTSYYSWLRDDLRQDPALMHFTLQSAYDNATANRNDVVLVMPDDYTLTAQVDWNKSQTHILGLGGPNQRHCPTTATTGAVRFYCATANVDTILKISGDYVQLQGFQSMNTVSDADNRGDILISGKNTFMRNIRPRGGNGANQLNNATAGVPLIIEASSGNGMTAVDCFFGSAGNSDRSAGVGAVLFEASAGAFAPVFRRCTFEMRCETNSSVPKLVHLAGNYAVDRYLLFDNCFFYNFWNNLVGKPPTVIDDDCATTHAIILKDSAQFGFDAWCTSATYCFTSSPIANTDGGETLAVATT